MHPSVILAAALVVFSGAAAAQVSVTEAWVRATVPQQRATGAFMTLRTAVDAKLVEARSPVAAVVELHEMAMDGQIMKMRAVSAVDVPAGRTVELKPGGYHVMLMDLRGRITAADRVPLTLVFEGKDGKRQTIEVNAIARELTTDARKSEQTHKGH